MCICNPRCKITYTHREIIHTERDYTHTYPLYAFTPPPSPPPSPTHRFSKTTQSDANCVVEYKNARVRYKTELTKLQTESGSTVDENIEQLLSGSFAGVQLKVGSLFVFVFFSSSRYYCSSSSVHWFPCNPKEEEGQGEGEGEGQGQGQGRGRLSYHGRRSSEQDPR